PAVFKKVDRLDAVLRTVAHAQIRAATRPAATYVSSQPLNTRLGDAIARRFSAQSDVIVQKRTVTAAIAPASFASLSWSEVHRQASAVVSLGDVMDAPHGRSDVAREAALELENIGKVATALYLSFGNVLPAIRLVWAETLSQDDAPVDLHRLSNL